MGEQKPKAVLKRSLRIYLGIVIFIFIALFVRLAWLQLVQTEIFLTQAASNSMRWIPEDASRGEIVDTNGQVLVTNRPVFNVSLNYLGLKDQDIDKVIENLVIIMNDPEVSFDSIKSQIKAQNRLYEPIVIKRDVPIELVTAIEERRHDLPGVSVNAQPQRLYPYGTLAGHLLGYVHSIKEELEQPGFEDYGLNDLVGKTGLEKIYEPYLRGEKGFRQVEVTALNQPVREVRSISPVPGNKLVLTIDLKLQQAMEKSFDEVLVQVQKAHPKAQAGAAVLLDVKTGKVLAMTSRPTLNPDDFNGKALSQERVDYYFRNLPPALYNRAVQGNYVPGSTFKPITGMAALESGKASPSDTVVCTGRYWNPPYIKCTAAHGRLNFYSAMAKSCNVYFQEMARRAGIAQIGRVGQEFGLGVNTGIDLPFESTGLLPTLEWQDTEFSIRREKINKEIDAEITKLENEYATKKEAAKTENEKKQLERELNSKKKSWEQSRKEKLAHYGEWHDYDTYNTGIGQGYNQFSIIQMANYTATIANGGKRYKPYLVEKVVDVNGNIVEEFQPELVLTSTVSPETIAETRKAMQSVTAPGGTGYSLFRNFPAEIKVGAKTGTAQPGRTGYVKNKDFDGLFIAFAPADDPQIAFAGVIEHGYSGSGSIGHVAKAVFEEYFGLNQQPPVGTSKTTTTTATPETTEADALTESEQPDADALTEPEQPEMEEPLAEDGEELPGEVSVENEPIEIEQTNTPNMAIGP